MATEELRRLVRTGTIAADTERAVKQARQALEYVVSRARAALVRDYMIERFHLDPGAVGALPLAADASGSPQGSTWSGIALAVFVER
jgi:hypothetical protein